MCTVQYNLPRLKLQKDRQKENEEKILRLVPKKCCCFFKSMVNKSKVHKNLNKSTLAAVWDHHHVDQ